MLHYLMLLQPLFWQECMDAMAADLELALKIIKTQGHQAPLRWFDSMEAQFKSSVKWVKDNQRHANHCTSPKTNETDQQGQPLPRNVIGSVSVDKNNCPQP